MPNDAITPLARTSPLDATDRRIRVVSAMLAGSCAITAIVLPLAVAWSWWRVSGDMAAARLGLAAGALALQDWQRALGAALTMLPAGLMVFGMLRARRCFRAFAAGDFFAAEAVRGLRGFAGAAFGSALLAMPVSAALSVLLTLGNPPGQRHLSIQIGSDQVFMLFVAGTIWLIAWVMARAAALAQENAEFI